MKLSVTAPLLLSLWSVAALADESCQLRMTPGSLDFGSATRTQLLSRSAPSGTDARFGVRTVHLRIHCQIPRTFRWTFVAPMADARRYQWGAGTLQIRITAARLDGATVQLRRDTDLSAEADLLRPGDHLLAWRDGAIVPGEQLEVELEIEAWANDAASRVRDLTRFEGHGTFRFDLSQR